MSEPVDNESFVLRVVTITLAIVVLSVVGALLIGLFDPLVSNDDVFKILGPAFSTVIGVFIGVLASKRLRKKDDEK